MLFETISLVNGILNIVVFRRSGVWTGFDMLFSKRQRFPFDVLSKQFDNAFVGDYLDASVAKATISTVFIEFLPREVHGLFAGVSIDNKHSGLLVLEGNGGHVD